MSIETEIASLTTAIRNLTDVLLASAANALPTATATFTAPAPAPTVSDPAPAPAPEPKKTVKKEPEPAPAPEPTPTPAPAPEPAPAPTVSEDDLRVQIVELARPNMGDAAFKAFLGGKLTELQGAACSISGTGKLPKIDAKHLPTLLAAINKQLGK
jgi:outer membrane biosynthesis protein TonB